MLYYNLGFCINRTVIVRWNYMKLIICGNGFDLHHGLKTSYKDYECYLKDTRLDIAEKYINFCERFSSLEGDYWSDIESSLALDTDKIAEHLADASENIRNTVSFIDLFTGQAFLEWLKTVDVENKFEDKDLSLCKEDCYINYNYTLTLEKLYSIPERSIFHIHGKITDVDESKFSANIIPLSFKMIDDVQSTSSIDTPQGINNELIREHIQFGSFNNNPSQIKESLTEKCTSENDSSALIDIVDYAGKSFKDIEKNITSVNDFIDNKTIDEIVIMGHNFLGVDETYYEKIFVKKHKNCIWTIYFHNGDSLINAILFIRKYGISKYRFFHW